MAQLFDSSGNVIQPRLVLPPGPSQRVKFLLHFVGEVPPSSVSPYQGSGNRPSKLALLPLGSFDLSAEEAGHLEQVLGAVSGLFLEAVESDGDGQRPRWQLLARTTQLRVNQSGTEEVT